MRRRAATAAAGLAAAVLAGAAMAQLPAPSPDPAAAACLTIDQAIALAVAGDPRIGRADASFRRAEAQTRIERAGARPQLSAFVRSGLGDGSGVQADNEFDNRAGLRLSQRLYDFGRTDLAVRAARLRADGEREGVREAQLAVAGEAGERFLAIARAEEKVAAAAIMVGYYARDAEQVDRRLDSGLLKLSEASGIRAEAARARARAAEEQLRADQDRTTLATLTGRSADCLRSEDSGAFLRARLPAALDLAVAEAAQRSPALVARNAEAAAAELDRKRASRGGLPDIGVSGTSALAFDRDLRGLDRTSRLGLDVTMPLYQGGQLRGRTDSAAAQARLVGFEVESERRGLANDVTIAWTRTRDLAPIADLNRQTLAALVDQAAATEREYESGLVTLTDLIEIRRNEYQGRIAEIDGRYDLMVERLRLLRLTSRLTVEP